MSEKLKCPFCGSENVIRMDGSGIVQKYGPTVMIDIAPEIVHCNDCNNDFKDDIFDNVEIDEKEANK